MTRLRSLEQLRGFAVMLMVCLHGALYHYGGLQEIDLTRPPVIVTLIGFLLMWGGLFAVLSGASHVVRAVERLDQGVALPTVRRWEWISGGGYVVLGVAYFTLVGPALLDLADDTRDSSLLVGWIEHGVVQAPSSARWLYRNTLFMIGFSTLLVAPVFAWLAQRLDPRCARFRWAIAVLAFLALATSWLRIPLYPLYEQAAAEGRTGFMLLTFWLVNKNDPMWPSLGLTLSGTLLGLTMVARAGPGRLRLPVGLGVLLLASGIAGWVFGPASMFRRSLDALAGGWSQSMTAAVLFGIASTGAWALILARWERSSITADRSSRAGCAPWPHSAGLRPGWTAPPAEVTMLPLMLQGLVDFFGLRWRFAHLRGERLRRYQAAACTRIVELELERSAFYRELYAGRTLGDLRSLPTIDKARMMAAFDRLNTAGLKLDEAMAFALAAERDKRYLGYWRDRYVVGLSSGTSGARGLYVTDRTISQRLAESAGFALAAAS